MNWGIRSSDQRNSVWLEALLMLAIAALLFQLFPSWGSWLLSYIDVRNWSRSTWMIVNISGVVGLLAARFGPELVQSLKDDWLKKQQATRRRRRTGPVFPTDEEYEERRKLAEDWRERAKKRRPWT